MIDSTDWGSWSDSYGLKSMDGFKKFYFEKRIKLGLPISKLNERILI